MKFSASFFALLLLSSIPIASAHPDPVGLTIQDKDGAVLYEKEIGVSQKEEPDSTELFSKEWIDHNFIWILIGTIITTMTVASLIIYREEITPKISKVVKRT